MTTTRIIINAVLDKSGYFNSIFPFFSAVWPVNCYCSAYQSILVLDCASPSVLRLFLCCCYKPQVNCYSMFETCSEQSANWWYLFCPPYRTIPSISSLRPSSPIAMAAVQYPVFLKSERHCQHALVRCSPKQQSFCYFFLNSIHNFKN